MTEESVKCQMTSEELREFAQQMIENGKLLGKMEEMGKQIDRLKKICEEDQKHIKTCNYCSRKFWFDFDDERKWADKFCSIMCYEAFKFDADRGIQNGKNS